MTEVFVCAINDLKKGSFVMLDGVASKVSDISTSKTGKHGHAKARIEAIGLVDNKKRILIKPTSDKIEVPIIEKKSAQVLSINGDRAQVMDSDSYEIFDIDIPEEFKTELNEGVSFLYWDIFDTRVIKQLKKEQ